MLCSLLFPTHLGNIEFILTIEWHTLICSLLLDILGTGWFHALSLLTFCSLRQAKAMKS